MTDTALLPQAVLDDETLCAYGVCVEKGPIILDHAIDPRRARRDYGKFALCVPHAQILIDDEPTVWISLDGRGR